MIILAVYPKSWQIDFHSDLGGVDRINKFMPIMNFSMDREAS
jgi:hypothetical protein